MLLVVHFSINFSTISLLSLPVWPVGEPWTIWVETQAESGASVPGPVSLVIYGEKGHSKTVYIGDELGYQFTEGETQECYTMVNIIQIHVIISTENSMSVSGKIIKQPVFTNAVS